MTKRYSYERDNMGGIILYPPICWFGEEPYEPSRYLQGDDAQKLIKDIQDTEKVWENGSEMTREILQRNFESVEGQISYIISQYF